MADLDRQSMNRRTFVKTAGIAAAAPEAAVLRAGVINRDDLAAGLDYPVDLPAHFIGILDRGDHVGGHDEVEMIVGKVEVGGVHDVQVEAAATIDIGGFFPGPFDHRPGNVDSHQLGPGRVKIQVEPGPTPISRTFWSGLMPCRK